MELLIEVVINGLLTGSIYAIIAIGLTLIFGVMKIINFAHGSYLMIAMYLCYSVVTLLGINPYLALIIVVPISYIIGYYSQIIFITPVIKTQRGVREPTGVLLITAGLWILINNLFLMLFGANYRSLENASNGATLQLGNMMISCPLLYGAIFSMLCAFALFTFLKKTQIGKAIRATGQDREAAGLVGINVFRIYNIAFGIGIAAVGVAGTIMVPLFYLQPFVGDVFDIRAFVIVVFGGLGSVPGALLGGLIIGLIESIIGFYFSMTWAEIVVYIAFLLALFLKPEGIFGLEKEW
jgi:branched-chain amino acid transport system permease protein